MQYKFKEQSFRTKLKYKKDKLSPETSATGKTDAQGE